MRQRARYSPLTADATVRLSNACRTPREKRIIWVLLDTGLRLGELAALSKADVDFRRNCLYAGAGTDRRAVPLTARIQPLLASWFEEHDSLGLCARSIQRIIRDVGARVRLNDVGAEVLRQTFALTSASEGTAPLELRRLLGLKTLSAIEVYLDLEQSKAAPGPK